MAFGNASAERAAIEMTYEDTATASRTTTQRGQNALTAPDPSVIYSGIIRALSYTGSDSSAHVSYTHLRAHETVLDLVRRLLFEKTKPY